ncbi:MAG: hypothetical protein JOZ51_03945 [Chloroflexi bacterium]|nr:hypothetical protein [Chloroflexota bacterium]
MTKDELLAAIFDSPSHPLADAIATWIDSSRRFAAFATTFHTKIRKKLRAAHEPESLRDLQLELETAYLLLRERALSVVYEPLPARQARGPDFAVSFTTSLEFMVEVTRLRSGAAKRSADAQDHESSAEATLTAIDERFSGMLGSKLGQLVPQRSNLLLVGVEALRPQLDDVHALMMRIQQRAEANDPLLIQRNDFRDRSDFFQHYQRLSAVLVRGIPVHPAAPVVLWINSQAKYPLPPKARTALTRSHTL